MTAVGRGVSAGAAAVLTAGAAAGLAVLPRPGGVIAVPSRLWPV
jgi:hypothetical protein